MLDILLLLQSQQINYCILNNLSLHFTWKLVIYLVYTFLNPEVNYYMTENKIAIDLHCKAMVTNYYIPCFRPLLLPTHAVYVHRGTPYHGPRGYPPLDIGATPNQTQGYPPPITNFPPPLPPRHRGTPTGNRGYPLQ